MNRNQRFVEEQKRKIHQHKKERMTKDSISRVFPPTTSPNTVRWFLAMKRGKLAKNDTFYTNIITAIRKIWELRVTTTSRV